MKQRRYPFVLLLLLIGASVMQAQQAPEQLRRLDGLAGAKFNANILEWQRDAEIARERSIVKDEFETADEFAKRKAGVEERVKRIRSEYEQRIASARQVFEQRIAEIKEEIAVLIDKSAEPVTSGISLGAYDAERGTFPIAVALDKTYDVAVPRQNAKEFKASASSLTAKGTRKLNESGGWSYYDWSITPADGAVYAFGEQTPGRRQAAGRISAPPELSASLSFSEPSGDNILYAGETGIVKISVMNKGAGAAFGIEGKISGAAIGIDIPSSVYIGEAAPGKQAVAEFKIVAQKSVNTGNLSLSIAFSEQHGFPPDPVKLTLTTKAFVPPSLAVTDIGISEPGGDGKIDPGEIIEITARIRNNGAGAAADVRAVFETGENIFLAQDAKTAYRADEIKPGGVFDVYLKAYANKMAKEFPVFLTVTEENGKYGVARYRLPLNFQTRAQRLEEVIIAGKETATGEAAAVAGLSVDVEQNVPKAGTVNKNSFAVIIGIEKYKNVQAVPFAKRDASWFKEYAVQALGVPDTKQNLYYVTDEDAGKAEFQKLFNKNGWIEKRVDANSTLYVFYAGHGAPDIQERSPYLLPADGDPNYPVQTGFPLNELYKGLAALPTQNVYVFLDACFSGGTREKERMLLADARPVYIIVDESAAAQSRLNIFAASSGDQISSSYREKKHGLFTYFLLKGLQGFADADGNKQITVGELENFVVSSVTQTAGLLDRVQTPVIFSPDKMKVISRY